jgi:hypothetical protein
MPDVSEKQPAPNSWLDNAASPPWGTSKSPHETSSRLITDMPFTSDLQPVFSVQGGGNQPVDAACGMVVASAKVMVASMTASMRAASQITWAVAAPTFSVALGGPNREHEEWVQCLHKRNTQQDRPWGNGVPPMMEIVPGPRGGDARVCSTNSALLTSMMDDFMAKVSKSRRDRRYDRSAPTFAVRGGACVSERYKGPADRYPLFATAVPSSPPREGQPPPRDDRRPPPRETRPPSPRDDRPPPRNERPPPPGGNPWADRQPRPRPDSRPEPTWAPRPDREPRPERPRPEDGWSPAPPAEEPPVTVTVWA